MKNKSSQISNPKFMWLSFFGIYFIVSSLIVPFASFNIITSMIYFAVIFVCMVFGYFLQSLVSKVIGFRREIESRAYESEHKYFKKSAALPVWIIAMLLGYLISLGVDAYLLERSKMPTFSYDPESVIPLTYAVLFFIAVSLGSFVWFFPYSRLMTGGGLYTGITIMCVIFAFHNILKSPNTVMVGICLLCYAFFALIASNQYSLGRTYRGTVVSFMTPQTRKYNLLLSLGLVILFLVVFFAAYLIINGLRVTFLFIIMAVARSMTNRGDDYLNDDEDVVDVSTNIFGKENVSLSIDYWMYILFVVFLFVFFTFIFTRRRPEFKKFIAWLKAVIVSLFEFFWLPIRDYTDRPEEFFTNYIDEEMKLQKDQKRARRPEEASARMTWRDFNAILRSKPTAEERYRYAYSTFVGQLRKMPLFIKKSDTPRKISERMSAGGKIVTKREIEEITEAFEQIEFADRPANGKTEEAMITLCDKIRENM